MAEPGVENRATDREAAAAPSDAEPGLGLAANAAELIATPPPGDAVAPTEPEIVDVWSRTEAKYRVRAAVLLLVDLVLFCGLCVFTHWLRFARAFDFSLDSYLAPARFWDATAPNLNDFILTPINVVELPLHAIVIGMVVAVLIAVPIVVAILYRFGFALPFLAAVVVFAHLPGMAATLLGSCILASLRPFRMRFRFGSAVLGLLPVLLYLYLATRGTPDQFADYAAPTQKSLLIAPWLIAVLAAAVMLGVMLLIARIVNYRPGAAAPVLAVMFAAPVGLFHVGVGVDELAYRVLVAEHGPRSRRFEPILKSRETEQAISRVIARELSRSFTGQLRLDIRAFWSLKPERLAELKRTVSRRFLADFLADRAEAYRACRRFIADYPQSRYVPNALYMQARVLDTRLDEAKLAHEEPSRELYNDFPHVQSEEIWLTLAQQYPHSPFATMAGLRLAELELRAGRVDEAAERLRDVLERCDPRTPGPAATQPRQRGFLAAATPEAHLEFQPEPYWHEARRLAELIAENRDDPKYGDAPLVELAALDPRRAGYTAQLLRLAERYRDSSLYDNLVVHWAAALPTVDERTAALGGCLRTFTTGDALPEALFRLASLETQALAAEDESRRAQGLAHLREIVARFPHSCWAEQAAERLEVLEPRAVENGGPQ